MRSLIETAQAFTTLKDFLGPHQVAVLARLARSGEEREFFREKLWDLAHLVDTMPKTYDQDGKGDEAIVYLHYFAGGSANWWITEKDVGSTEDEPGTGQVQAFGYADLFGDELSAELGYISIAEILECGGELDLYFRPRTLGEVKRKHVGHFPTDDANALLIAAAPDLLEAARAMRAVAAMADSELYEGEAARTWQQLNAAIKKAEGSVEP